MLKHISASCNKHVSGFLFRHFCLVAILLLISVSAYAQETSPNPHYAVQAGLYVGPIQSNRMAENLIRAGYSAWVQERPQGQNKNLYYVLVGPFADQKQAIEAMQAINRKFDVQSFLVDLDQY